MATTNGDRLTQIPHAGTFGNRSAFNAQHNFVNELQNNVVRLAKIPSGVEVLDIAAFFEAFGAARTIDLGYTPVDSASSLTPDPDYWTPSPIDVSSAGADRSNTALPIKFTEDVYLIATLAGAAGADAELAAVLDYVYHGNL